MRHDGRADNSGCQHHAVRTTERQHDGMVGRSVPIDRQKAHLDDETEAYDDD